MTDTTPLDTNKNKEKHDVKGNTCLNFLDTHHQRVWHHPEETILNLNTEQFSFQCDHGHFRLTLSFLRKPYKHPTGVHKTIENARNKCMVFFWVSFMQSHSQTLFHLLCILAP